MKVKISNADTRPFMRAEHVAARLGISVKTLLRKVKINEAPPSVRMGRIRFWRPESFETWLAEREQESVGGLKGKPHAKR